MLRSARYSLNSEGAFEYKPQAVISVTEGIDEALHGINSLSSSVRVLGDSNLLALIESYLTEPTPTSLPKCKDTVDIKFNGGFDTVGHHWKVMSNINDRCLEYEFGLSDSKRQAHYVDPFDSDDDTCDYNCRCHLCDSYDYY